MTMVMVMITKILTMMVMKMMLTTKIICRLRRSWQLATTSKGFSPPPLPTDTSSISHRHCDNDDGGDYGDVGDNDDDNDDGDLSRQYYVGRLVCL